MREIKFRAWVLKDGKMIQHRNRAPAVKMFTRDYGYTNKEVIVMQYTGLKDKNGAEIYEGDILSTDLDRPYLIVEFRNGAFMFQCHDNGKDYYDFMATTDENSNFTKYHEVIGNIHEHPHPVSSK